MSFFKWVNNKPNQWQSRISFFGNESAKVLELGRAARLCSINAKYKIVEGVRLLLQGNDIGANQQFQNALFFQPALEPLIGALRRHQNNPPILEQFLKDFSSPSNLQLKISNSGKIKLIDEKEGLKRSYP